MWLAKFYKAAESVVESFAPAFVVKYEYRLIRGPVFVCMLAVESGYSDAEYGPSKESSTLEFCSPGP
jgi:hypothetical protein